MTMSTNKPMKQTSEKASKKQVQNERLQNRSQNCLQIVDSVALFTFKLGLVAVVLLSLTGCAPKDRGYGLSGPSSPFNVLGQQDQSLAYVRHALFSLDHARQSLEFAISQPVVPQPTIQGPTPESTQAPSQAPGQLPGQAPEPTTEQAEGAIVNSVGLVKKGSQPVSGDCHTVSRSVVSGASGASPLGEQANAGSGERVEAILLKYNGCAENSAAVSSAVQSGQESFVVSYSKSATLVAAPDALLISLPDLVAVQIDLQYELDRAGSKYDKVYINQVASLTFAKVSETDQLVNYKVSYDARESFDLDVQLVRRFGELNPTFQSAVFSVDKKTRKVISLGSPQFSLFVNSEQWKKSDVKGTSLLEKKKDVASLTIGAVESLSVPQMRCQLPQGNLDLKFLPGQAGAKSSDDAVESDNLTHFTSLNGKLVTDGGVEVEQGSCTSGSSNLDPAQAGYIGDLEPLYFY